MNVTDNGIDFIAVDQLVDFALLQYKHHNKAIGNIRITPTLLNDYENFFIIRKLRKIPSLFI